MFPKLFRRGPILFPEGTHKIADVIHSNGQGNLGDSVISS